MGSKKVQPRPDEAFAAARWEAVTGRKLEFWEKPPRNGVVDFRCLSEPTVSLEVKQLTERGFHQDLKEFQKQSRFLATDRLQRRWSVHYSLPTNQSPNRPPKLAGLLEDLVPVLVELEKQGISSSSDGMLAMSTPVKRLRFFAAVMRVAVLG